MSATVLYQRVLLNGQTSSWELVKSRVPQGSVHGPLFIYYLFFICINDLLDNLESNSKNFAFDTTLFYKVFDKHFSRATLNKRFRINKRLAFSMEDAVQSRPK